MSTIKSIRNSLLEREEEIIFFVSVIVLLSVTPRLIEILTRPWSIEGGLFHGIANLIWMLDSDGISKIVSLVFGFYFISILFLISDEKKRIQTIMLIFVLLIVIYNVIIGNIFPQVKLNLIWIGAGLIAGVFASSDKENNRNILRDILKGKVAEYKKPAKNLTYISLLIVIVSFFSYYAELLLSNQVEIQTKYIIWDFIVVLIFVMFFKRFMNYEPISPNIFVLGQKKSGKSLFLAGAYLNSLESEGTYKISPSGELIELIDEMQKYDWPAATNEIRHYSFTYRHGKLFPKDVEFYTYDYTGAYLENISELMEKKKDPNEKTEEYIQKFDEMLGSIVTRIKKSDKLIFLLDGGQYPNFANMGIKEYMKILKFLNDNHFHKDYYIVVTKCDLFLDAYKEKTGQNIITDESYDAFTDFINDLFLGNISTKPLVKDTQCDFLYPIFYHTVKLEDGTLIPLKDIRGNIWPPFGYRILMNDLVK